VIPLKDRPGGTLADSSVSSMMQSAWIKWARAMEHQKVPARATREFRTGPRRA